MKKSLLISGILITLITVSACSSLFTDTPTETNVENSNSEQETSFNAQSLEPQYVDYSGEILSQVEGERPYVLFFHAVWCPICRTVEKNVNAELSSFPEGTLILETDYDTETELKKRHEVRAQSTLLIFNSNNEIVERLVGPDNDQLKEAIEKSLT